ncbi:MAG: Na/Pi cotransporter family protein [Puniceicoccaceae bacterium]|nr:MAG: Na/Pi cotransporter family protein [Puniceicoccaceae bacterium]
MIWLVFNLAGGLALFLFGMKALTTALQEAAGDRLRETILAATRRRSAGLLLGTGLGFLAHSSAATAMTVGFVNAGLLSVASSLPVLFGANIGTTLSMQLISFRLTDLALAGVALGFLLQQLPRPVWAARVGKVILGLSLIFLGMKIMGDALGPYREELRPWLLQLDGSTFAGMLLGIAVAAFITFAVQSSGAVIGMTFVLIDAGVITDIHQVYPIVLGTHLGTCTTALIASIGTEVDARRAALGNLGFNCFNVALGVLAAPLFIAAVTALPGSLVRQTANLHTLVMVAAALLLLPAVPWLSRLLRVFWGGSRRLTEGSHLSPELLSTPEDAIHAVLRELSRTATVLEDGFHRASRLLQGRPERGDARRLRLNEATVDELKASTKSFLQKLTRDYLSRRQALLVQGLNRAADGLERVGDHLARLGELGEARLKSLPEPLTDETRRALDLILRDGDTLIELLRDSLQPAKSDFTESAHRVFEAVCDYEKGAAEAKQAVNARVADHRISAAEGLFFSECGWTLERLVRHLQAVASEQVEPQFYLRSDKLGRPAEPGPKVAKRLAARSTGDDA